MSQRGFTIVEGVILVAVIVVLAGVGFVAYNNFAAPKPTDTTVGTSEDAPHSHDMNSMSQVTSTKDLDEAMTSLDDASFENDGQTDIDSQSSQF